MAIVLRWFGVRPLGAAAGAYVFAFGLLRMDHLTHLQLFPQFYSPFAIWYAWAVLREPSRRRWTILVAVVSLQVFSSLHLGWFLGLGIAIFACFAFGVERSSLGRVWSFVRHQPVVAILPVLVAGLCLGAYARNFYRGTPERREFAEVARYLPFPDGWIVAPPNSLWADALTPRPMDDFGERCLFQGVVLYALIVLSLRFAVRRVSTSRTLVICCLCTALSMALSVTRFGYEVSPWALVHAYIPGANAFRAVGRAAFVAYLFGLIGGLRGLEEFAERLSWQNRFRNFLVGAVVLAMAIEQYRSPLDSFDKRDALYGRAEQLRATMRGADAAYVVYDGSMPDYRHHIIAMWAGLWERVPVMNGFSGTQPSDGYPAYGDHPTIDHLVRSLGTQWQGKLVVIEWGPPIHRRTYNVEIGGRFTLAADD